MLGRVIRDPEHVEPSAREAEGLGLLPVETVFETAKATCRVRARVLGAPGWLGTAASQEVEGYEIHMGRTSGGRPWLERIGTNGSTAGPTDGAASADGRVWGCYLHGLFANPALRRPWLASLSASPLTPTPLPHGERGAAGLDAALDRLADAVEAALDMRRLEAILDQNDPK
jgi:adenosylcobyric acid synthase